MKIIETDLRMLTYSAPLNDTRAYRQSGTNLLVMSGKAGRYKAWQTWSALGDTLRAVSARSNIADPVVITFDKYSEGFPLAIRIENPFIGMKLSLRKLTR